MTDFVRVLFLGFVIAFLPCLGCATSEALSPTVADLKPINGGVSVTREGSEAEARTLLRLGAGDLVSTNSGGRARVRLDDGTSLLMDRETRITLDDSGFRVERGRVFVQSPPKTRSQVAIGTFSAVFTGANVAFELRDKTLVYCASGEATLLASGEADGNAEHKLNSGEQALIDGNSVAVEPGRAFDDWTFGLMASWAAYGVERRAVGELWGRSDDSLGSPLTIRAHDVEVVINGEGATTRVRTTYFNGGSSEVSGDFRLALPPEAIVSRFAYGSGEQLTATAIGLSSREEKRWVADSPRLEWAGEGLLRGRLPLIASGATTTVEIEYVEWLSPRRLASGQWALQYRYPLTSESDAPLIGEFTARIDAGPSNPTSLAAGMGAKVNGDRVEVRRSDFVPTADLVVDVGIEGWKKPGRLYTADAKGNDQAGDFVLVRTEAPAPAKQNSAPLVLVLDTSRSVEISGGEAARAFVRAVLGALTPNDRIVLIGADQTSRAVGGEQMAALDEKRRAEILKALDRTSSGGATDLGAALEAGVAATPPEAPETLVIYIGDGWGSLGDEDLEAIRARLARRVGWEPRLGAVAVGASPNRVLLSALTRGVGPLFEIKDQVDAARAASELVSLALKPVLSSVELDLGPVVERVYPRHPVTLPAGESVTVVGRVRGAAPKSGTLRYRDGQGDHSQTLELTIVDTVDEGDLQRRWAQARVDDLVLGLKGREVVTDIALGSGLITPWTALTPDGASYTPTDISSLLLDLDFPPSGGLIPSLLGGPMNSGALKRPTSDFGVTFDDPDVPSALTAAVERKLRDAREAIRACRDARAASLPDAPDAFFVQLKVGGDGQLKGVEITSRGKADEALERCIRRVVQGLAYPNLGLRLDVEVSVDLRLPPYVVPTNRRCSGESKLPLGARRGYFQEELQRHPGAAGALQVYMDSKRDCEVRTWREKRTLLDLVLENLTAVSDRLKLVQSLSDEGQTDAAAYLREQTIVRARSPEEFEEIERVLIANERLPVAAFKEAYEEAKTDAARLDVVHRFLLLAPHDNRLRRLLVALLQATQENELLLEEIRRLRQDPFSDVALLADSAHILRGIGHEGEARRVFGELIERAPHDPWVRAFLGDRLRNEQWFDDATSTYSVLSQMAPGEPRVVVRQALAHAGAGRLDLSRRMLLGIAETGGRDADSALAQLSRQLLNSLTQRALENQNWDAATKEALALASRQMPRPRRGSLLLLRAPAAEAELDVQLQDPDGATSSEPPRVIRAPGIGIYSLERAIALPEGTKLTLRGPERLAPMPALSIELEVLEWPSPDEAPQHNTQVIELPLEGKEVILAWNGEAFVAERELDSKR